MGLVPIAFLLTRLRTTAGSEPIAFLLVRLLPSIGLTALPLDPLLTCTLRLRSLVLSISMPLLPSSTLVGCLLLLPPLRARLLPPPARRTVGWSPCVFRSSCHHWFGEPLGWSPACSRSPCRHVFWLRCSAEPC